MQLDSSPFEVAGEPGSIGPFVYSCEHASNRLPAMLVANETDATLLADHWGWDVGAADLVGAMLATFGGRAVLARYSRLVIDLNREPESPELIVTEAEGRPISFNQSLTSTDREAREAAIFAPYHQAVDAMVRERVEGTTAPVTLLSVHSFTPVFRGKRRSVEIGVLFDQYDERAIELADGLRTAGFESGLNQPYSGKPPGGLVYSVARHGRAHRVPYIELEVRSDLIDTPAKAAAVCARMAEPLRQLARAA